MINLSAAAQGRGQPQRMFKKPYSGSVRGTERIYSDCETLSVVGGGSIIRHQDLQAAAGGGGRLGDDQGAVGSDHFLAAHVGADRGGIRDPEETEPAI